MNAAHSPATSALFGDEEHLSVSRALGELQARRPIRVNAPGEVLFALPVEGLDDQRLHEFAALCGRNSPELIVTQQRARAIGIEASMPMALPLSSEARASDIFALAADAESKGHFSPEAEAAGPAARAAIRLVKFNRSLPAVLAANVASINSDLMHSIVSVEADAVERFVPDEGVLHYLLGEVEVAEHADERRDRPPGLLPKQALDRLRRGAYRAASASARVVCTCDPAAS